jgi:hypothetical protein
MTRAVRIRNPSRVTAGHNTILFLPHVVVCSAGTGREHVEVLFPPTSEVSIVELGTSPSTATGFAHIGRRSPGLETLDRVI